MGKNPTREIGEKQDSFSDIEMEEEGPGIEQTKKKATD